MAITRSSTKPARDLAKVRLEKKSKALSVLREKAGAEKKAKAKAARSKAKATKEKLKADRDKKQKTLTEQLKARRKTVEAKRKKAIVEEERNKRVTREAKEKETWELEMGYELARQDPSKFVFFRKLPIELRLEIWKLARPEGRLIKLAKSKHHHSTYSSAKVPSLLHASCESREIALKWYELSFARKTYGIYPPGLRKQVYFDWAVDGILIQCTCSVKQLCQCADYTHRTEEDDINKIQKLVWEGHMDNYHPALTAHCQFPALEELIVIRNQTMSVRAELKLSSVVDYTEPLEDLAVTEAAFWSKFNGMTNYILSLGTNVSWSLGLKPSALKKVTKMSLKKEDLDSEA